MASRKPLSQTLGLTVAVVTSITLGWASSQILNRNYIAQLEISKARSEHDRRVVRALRRQLEEKLVTVSEPGINADASESGTGSELEARLDRLSSEVETLRGALDPTKEEVLTVLRLKDRIIELEEEREEFEDQMMDRYKELSASMEARVKVASDSVKWLLLVVIPLVINLVYSIWKDVRGQSP
ncbi:MAG: hypothetical protein AAGN66_06925 [Acidobacteriota bacterium]